LKSSRLTSVVLFLTPHVLLYDCAYVRHSSKAPRVALVARHVLRVHTKPTWPRQPAILARRALTATPLA